jgi:hypothetical protein
MYIPPPFASVRFKPLKLIRTAETWRKCGLVIPALVVLEVCLAIAGCAGETAPTPGSNQASTIPTPTISTVSPASNMAGSPAFTLTVNAKFPVFFGGQL